MVTPTPAISTLKQYDIIKKGLKKALKLPRDYFDDVVGILCLLPPDSTINKKSPFQRNVLKIKEFFPIAIRNENNDTWEYSLNAVANGKNGKIIIRPYFQNECEYVQIKFDGAAHDLRKNLDINDRLIFIKKKDSDFYEMFSIPSADNPFQSGCGFEEDFILPIGSKITGIEDKTLFAFPPFNPDKKHPLNQILFGAPGTGKTYNAINHALSIIKGYDLKDLINSQFNNKPNRVKAKNEFDELVKIGQIQFVTFHQSYSYEEFVEGIRPSVKDKEVEYNIVSGIFKKLCETAMKKEFFDFDEIYDQFIDDLTNLKSITLMTSLRPKSFRISLDGDKVIATNSRNNQIVLTRLATQVYFEKGILSPWHEKAYVRGLGDYLKKNYASKITPIDNAIENFVLIIDEINRGNISKIFGELITLIEDSKRIGNDEELRVKLTYSSATEDEVAEENQMFGVPKNIFIIGTMNTADKSIALVDLALRRRFTFIEYCADPELLQITSDGIDLKEMLKMINKRIELLLDKDHFIGHAYFMGKNNKKDIFEVFKNKIIPLLQEYFHNDFKNVAWVLGDHDDWKGIDKDINDNLSFRLIRLRKNLNLKKIFGFSDKDEFDEKKNEIYYINSNLAKSEFTQPIEALTYIYKTPAEQEVKAEEVKAEEVKAEEVKAEEVKAEEVKAEEVKAEEVKAEKVKAKEVKA